jgi:hypothetical protein
VSTITVLRGLVDVYRRDPVTGNAVGPATAVGARESITVKAGPLAARPQTISPDHARRLSNDFTAPVQPVSPAGPMVTDEVTRTTNLFGIAGTAATRTDLTTPTRLDGIAVKADTTLAPTATLTPTTTLTPLPTISTVPTINTTPTISTTPTTTVVPILPSNLPLVTTPLKR